jgi:hypothetical protein
MCFSHFLEQFQGYQKQPDGTGNKQMQAGLTEYRQNFKSSVLTPNIEHGFNGFRFGLTLQGNQPFYIQKGYAGQLPIKEQPKLNVPLPYHVSVLG